MPSFPLNKSGKAGQNYTYVAPQLQRALLTTEKLFLFKILWEELQISRPNYHILTRQTILVWKSHVIHTYVHIYIIIECKHWGKRGASLPHPIFQVASP